MTFQPPGVDRSSLSVTLLPRTAPVTLPTNPLAAFETLMAGCTNSAGLKLQPAAQTLGHRVQVESKPG